MMSENPRRDPVGLHGTDAQADDEDDPTPLRSWNAGTPTAEQVGAGSRHKRLLSVLMIVAGCGGIASGLVQPRMATELVLGSLLVVVGLQHFLFGSASSN
jgi:hypothetical protein